MDQLILIGGGGHCRSVIDVIEQEGRFEIAGIVDQPELIGTDVLGYKVIASDAELPGLAGKFRYALVTVGQVRSPKLRITLFKQARSAGFQLPVIVSPRAYVSQHATVGEGTVVMHDSLVNANASVGRNCIINTKTLIEHDSYIGDHCHISTGAVINGTVKVERGCFVGSHATTSQSITIDPDSFVKAGSLVT